ncbi:hypothetical protein E4T56_gene18777 [Termitomyces sp. T112]|nr:hypothetical protein E4T56_gene18777 [Termitomyces sp. T112]
MLGRSGYLATGVSILVKTSYAPCRRHGPVALASSQTQPHFVWLGPRYSTQCFIPDPTSLRLVRSSIFHSMLHPRPNLTSFVRSLYFKLNASSQTQPHFVQLGPQYSTQCFIPDPTSLRSVRSLYFKLNANSQTQPHFVWLGPCISNSMLSPRTTENIYTTLSTHIH